MLMRNMFIFGFGGVIVLFLGIKLIDLLIIFLVMVFNLG